MAGADVEPNFFDSVPDKLNQLCCFKIMNNIDILIASLLEGQSENGNLCFPLELGNSLMDYFMRYSIPLEKNKPYVDKLVQLTRFFDRIRITRDNLFTREHLETLSQNEKQFRSLEITFEDEGRQALATKTKLLEKNLTHLTHVSVYQNCPEYSMESTLKVLSGEDPDAEDSADGSDEGDNAGSSDERDSSAINEMEQDCSPGLAKNETGFSTDETHAMKAEESAGADSLEYFSYEQQYSDIHPNCDPAYNYSWMYKSFASILDRSPRIKSFRLLTLLSNPIEWFLSLPNVSNFQNLDSLTLNVSYEDTGSVSTEEMRLPYYTPRFFSQLPLLKQLRHLDLSRSSTFDSDMEEDYFEYTDEQVDEFIAAVKVMPNLCSLDISGTNLYPIMSRHEPSETNCSEGHCMEGFKGRRFDYLGLFMTRGADGHRHIPAEKVSGTCSTDQLLVALGAYQSNRCMLHHVIVKVQNYIEGKEIARQAGMELFDAIVRCLRHFENGTELDFEKEVMKKIIETIKMLIGIDEVRDSCTIKQRRQLLDILLVIQNNCVTGRNSSTDHMLDSVVRTSMHLMKQLQLQDIAVYCYKLEQYIAVLQKTFVSESANDFRKLEALKVIYKLVRQGQDLKILVGQRFGTMKTILDYLRRPEMPQISDVCMRLWSILWSMTDDAPSMCNLFVELDGCALAQNHIEIIPNVELRNKVTGVMRNLSENFKMHEHLMTNELVGLFRRLIAYGKSEDFVVSTHAVDFLIMMACREPHIWTIQDPSRETILSELEAVIKQWDVRMGKKIKFRSLAPMLRQIENEQCGVAQLWGAWEILNLLYYKRERYRDMLHDEHGYGIVKKVLEEQPRLRDDVREMLTQILESKDC